MRLASLILCCVLLITTIPGKHSTPQANRRRRQTVTFNPRFLENWGLQWPQFLNPELPFFPYISPNNNPLTSIFRPSSTSAASSNPLNALFNPAQTAVQRGPACRTHQGGQGMCLSVLACPFVGLNLFGSICLQDNYLPGTCCPNYVLPSNYFQGQQNPSKPNNRPTITYTPAEGSGDEPFTSDSQSIVDTLIGQRPTPDIIRPITRPGSITRPVRPIASTTNQIRPIASTANQHRPGATSIIRPDFASLSGSNEVYRCGESRAGDFRIIGGTQSARGDWPWMAVIYLHGRTSQHYHCGGSLVSDRSVLTAAHCTRDRSGNQFSTSQMSVRLGDYNIRSTLDDHDSKTYRVTRIITHPEFQATTFSNDLAIIRLDTRVDYSRSIAPVCLPSVSLNNLPLDYLAGREATVIGYGRRSYGGAETSVPLQVEVPIWTNSECDKSYAQDISRIFICAGHPQGGRDACQVKCLPVFQWPVFATLTEAAARITWVGHQTSGNKVTGDSGGPLLIPINGRWVQIGIVSSGLGCGKPGFPGVYTRISEFLSWIKRNAS